MKSEKIGLLMLYIALGITIFGFIEGTLDPALTVSHFERADKIFNFAVIIGVIGIVFCIIPQIIRRKEK